MMKLVFPPYADFSRVRFPEAADPYLQPDSKKGCYRCAVHDLWLKHKKEGMLPTSARFFYYELVNAGVISKTRPSRTDGKKGRDSNQDLNDALSDLRKSGHIPWTDIEDETRELSRYAGSSSIADSMRFSWQYASLDLWKGHGEKPLIICESRSLKGVLEHLASEYQAKIAATNGWCVGFLHTDLAPALRRERPVLYFGDADFSGGKIEKGHRDVLERIVGRKLDWERVAVTEEQIKKFKLPVIMKYDARTKSKHPAVETEALGQARIVELLRERLAEMMPKERIERVRRRQERERRKLGLKLGYVKKGKKRGARR